MIEIKFRAWDGDKLIGFGDLMCRQGYFDAFINTIAETTAANNPNGPKYNLMQYTGLKDKNGVEIYEGDILQRSSSINSDYHGEWIRDEVIYKPGVFFASHISSDKGRLPRGYTAGGLLSSYFDYDGKLFAFSSDYEPSCFGEVIGNIYENPELLEANQ